MQGHNIWACRRAPRPQQPVQPPAANLNANPATNTNNVPNPQAVHTPNPNPTTNPPPSNTTQDQTPNPQPEHMPTSFYPHPIIHLPNSSQWPNQKPTSPSTTHAHQQQDSLHNENLTSAAPYNTPTHQNSQLKPTSSKSKSNKSTKSKTKTKSKNKTNRNSGGQFAQTVPLFNSFNALNGEEDGTSDVRGDTSIDTETRVAIENTVHQCTDPEMDRQPIDELDSSAADREVGEAVLAREDPPDSDRVPREFMSSGETVPSTFAHKDSSVEGTVNASDEVVIVTLSEEDSVVQPSRVEGIETDFKECDESDPEEEDNGSSANSEEEEDREAEPDIHNASGSELEPGGITDTASKKKSEPSLPLQVKLRVRKPSSSSQ